MGSVELLMHLRSPRLLILVLVFSLLVLGAAFGLSESLERPDPGGIQIYGHPVILNETGVERYAGIALLADYYGDPAPGQLVLFNEIAYGVGPDPIVRTLSQGTSNASGFVTFVIGTEFPPQNRSYEFRSGVQASQISFPPDLRNRTFTIVPGAAGFSSPFGSQYAFYLHILSIGGEPASTAEVYLNATFVGHPDGRGFIRILIPRGTNTIRVSYGGVDQSFPASNVGPSGPVYENGADAVLAGMSFTLIPLLLPVVAIAVSFDAISRERSQGTLDLLLCRPVSRPGIIAGKFFGAFVAVALPVLAVLLAGIGVVSIVSGRLPSASFTAAFIVASLFLIGTYVLLALTLSTLARSMTTSVVLAIALWIVFGLLFTSLLVLLLVAGGLNPATRGFHETLAVTLLFDPNTLYQMLVASGTPGSNVGPLGFVPSFYVSPTAQATAAVLWLTVLTLIATLTFSRRAGSGVA